MKGCVRFLLIVVLLLSLSMHCASALHVFFSGFAPALTYLSFLQTQTAWKSPSHTCPHYSLVSCLTECYVPLLLRTVYFAHCVTCHIICLLVGRLYFASPNFISLFSYCIIMHVISCRLLCCSSCVLDDAVTFSALLQSFLLTQKVIRILGPLAEKAGGTTRRVYI